MSNRKVNQKEINEAVQQGLRNFRESTDSARTVDPAGYEDPALYQDATGKGAILQTLQTPHDAAQNAATIAAKPSDAQGGGVVASSNEEEEGEQEEVKEFTSTADYLASLLDEESLSEDFTEKLTTIFDAALNERIEFIQSEMQESFNSALNEQVESITEDLSEKLDDFLSYVVQEWTTDNYLAIERGIKADIAESFLSGLKALFESHYIEMPDEKVNVVDELHNVNEDLEYKLNEQLQRNIELMGMLNKTAAQSAFASLCEDMTDTQVERFAQLAETVEYQDYDQYVRKLNILKESFIGSNRQSHAVESAPTNMLTEDIVHNGGNDPLMEAYSKAIGFQNRNKK